MCDFELNDPSNNIQKNEQLLKKHLSETNGRIITRFPPEPNGYLHIGHAKAIHVNFNYAKKKNGLCYLRFDDTNPSKEKQEYVTSIIDDINWLGYNPDKITYTSDYFDQLINFGKKLILLDKAYICELDQEIMQKQRMEMINSPFRDRPIEESLNLFEQMINKKIKEGEMTLRLKCDMQSNNPIMRDMVAYRIINKIHPKTGDKYILYPTYDFSHCIIDSLENITHSLCSIEFQPRNELYRWILDELELYKPPQIEYCRLTITNTVLSKRKLINLVEEGIVSGWDDPRMPTIKGIRRRGYTANGINEFCRRIGLSLGTTSALVSYKQLEEYVRIDLDKISTRIFAIINPLKINIINWEKEDIDINIINLPILGNKSDSHKMKFGKEIYIDRNDFRMQDDPKYYRLAPNKIVRLRYAFPIKCVKVIEENDEIKELICEYLPNYDKKIKGTINWVHYTDNCSVTINEFEHLFPEKFDPKNDLKNQITTKSIKKYDALTDPYLKNVVSFDKFQFERIGYFSVDPDSGKEKIIVNKIMNLHESIEKKKIG